MVWLVLESVAMPNWYRLYSKAKWDSMTKHERYWHKVVKECATRDEANVVLDELRQKAKAALKGKVFAKGAAGPAN
jgi:hypothetical protein